MDFHCSPSQQLWITSQPLSVVTNLMLSSCFLLCLPLSLVPSSLPVLIDSCMLPSLIMCPKSFICCSLIRFSSSFSVTCNVALKENTERRLQYFSASLSIFNISPLKFLSFLSNFLKANRHICKMEFDWSLWRWWNGPVFSWRHTFAQTILQSLL